MHTRGVIASAKFSRTSERAARERGMTAPLPVQLALGLRSLVLVDDEAEMRRRFAYALRAAMSQKGWKGPDLARAIHRDASTVNRWVEEKSLPNIMVTKDLAEALEVRPEFLFDPPPVPDYPLSQYLVERAAAPAVAEGARRARQRRGGEGQ